MAQRKEDIQVGAVVTVAIALFLIALVFVGGVNLFHKKNVNYTMYFKFAGGLEPGSYVRFGGLKVGTVQEAHIDPGDSTRIRVQIAVRESTPIRTNSKARISSLGLLGENYIEITPGTRDAPRLPPGTEIPTTEIVQLADLFGNVNGLTLGATKLVTDIDNKVLVLADNINQVLASVNDVVSEPNRQHLNAALANVDAMLAETRPQLKSTLDNVNQASAKVSPTIDSAHAVMDKANTAVASMNSMIQENRPELHQALLRLRESLVSAQGLMGDIDDTLNSNRPNLDETLDNIRAASVNLKQFTDEVKQRPFSLIRITAEKDRVPPTGK